MSSIDHFWPSWNHARSLTLDFIRCVPDNKWDWSPNPRYGSMCKQFRHVLCVQGVYVEGIRHRVTDFGTKHSHYDGPLDREALIEGLQRMDENLLRVLQTIDKDAENAYLIEFYGTQQLGTFLNTILYHEALHQGQWSFFATLGEFETPQSWKVNWGL